MTPCGGIIDNDAAYINSYLFRQVQHGYTSICVDLAVSLQLVVFPYGLKADLIIAYCIVLLLIEHDIVIHMSSHMHLCLLMCRVVTFFDAQPFAVHDRTSARVHYHK